MSDDAELQRIRSGVSCAAVLDRLGGWRLDRAESTRRSPKYRRGDGEILILNHDGRGWWDPLSQDKGDVFDLIQRLESGLNFSQVLEVLRRFMGVPPSHESAPRPEAGPPGRGGRGEGEAIIPPAERWERRPRLRPGSPAWRYLAHDRALPARILDLAATRDVVREGFQGGAWFAYRENGEITHVDARGPRFRGSLAGGRKTLFRFGDQAPGMGSGERRALTRLVIAEAAIDALSIAAIENSRPDTLYVATGGGMGPNTIAALQPILRELAVAPDALAVSAADANEAGDRFAIRHATLALEGGVRRFERLRPPDGLDWNDVLQQRRSRR